MKHRVWKIIIAGVLMSIGIWAGMVLDKPLEAGSAANPGSIDDPVVTKSYVDEQIAKFASGTGGAGSGSGGTGTTTGSGGATPAMVPLEVVYLPIGSTLMAAAGTEVVVRVGQAIAYSSDTNGVSDLTGGADIKSGGPVPTNHLIWFPRDGRGIKGHPDEIVELILVVRGSYTIK